MAATTTASGRGRGAAAAVLAALAAAVPQRLRAAAIGPTFGYGYLPGEGFFCTADNGGRGTVVLNHTLSPGSTHGVLTHFWATGPGYEIDRVWVNYYLDGESTPSIRFQPSMACGVAFPFAFYESQPKAGGSLFSAGSLCGKNAAVGGFWHDFPIPFSKSVIVTVQPGSPADGKCVWGYMNVHGTENLPLSLPGSSIPVPPSARMTLQRNDLALHQPLEYVHLLDIPAGQSGLVFQTSFGVENQPVGGPDVGAGYIEGCFNFYPTAQTPFPGVVVGTGVEDFFDSAFYFGAATHYGAQTFTGAQTGLTYFHRSNATGTERLSGYRFHITDPLAFTDGAKMVWKVGGADNTTKDGRVTKCGAPYAARDSPRLRGALPQSRRPAASVLSAVNMTSYVWALTWPAATGEW